MRLGRGLAQLVLDLLVGLGVVQLVVDLVVLGHLSDQGVELIVRDRSAHIPRHLAMKLKEHSVKARCYNDKYKESLIVVIA